MQTVAELVCVRGKESNVDNLSSSNFLLPVF